MSEYTHWINEINVDVFVNAIEPDINCSALTPRRCQVFGQYTLTARWRLLQTDARDISQNISTYIGFKYSDTDKKLIDTYGGILDCTITNILY